MKEAALFVIGLLAIGILLFWAYRNAMQRMEERVTEKLAEAQREHQRQQRAAMGLTPPQNNHEAILQEMEGIPQEIFEKDCADVLSQISARRKQFRRPTTRRRVTKAE